MGIYLLRKHFHEANIQEKVGDILDLGCGTGSLAKFLRPYSKKLVGIDLSSDMLIKAEKTELYDSILKRDVNGVFKRSKKLLRHRGRSGGTDSLL